MKIFSVVFMIVPIAIAVWLFRLNHTIEKRIEHGWFKPPVEIFARGETIRLHQILAIDELPALLRKMRYRERYEGQTLQPNDFTRLDLLQCAEMLSAFTSNKTLNKIDEDTPQENDCIYFRTPDESQGRKQRSQSVLIGFTSKSGQLTSGPEQLEIARIVVDGAEAPSYELTPQLFAQFYDGEPILRQVIQVGDVPLACLQAVTAIEDSQFLNHKGVSLTGLARALVHNIISGGYVQGGSTITQQLVKNYFLTSEKTLKRKLSELAMAVLLELHANKDQILESYLNVAYMGQRGPFQVIGLGAASEYYFARPLSDLNLSECALLAAIINSPRRFNPFTNPDNAISRRNFVLERMVETNMISEEQMRIEKTKPLPSNVGRRLVEPAPHFTQAIFREIKRLNLNIENGLRIYSTLDINAQDIAQKKVRAHVEKLNKPLEASLISVEVASGEVLALVGGKHYVKNQYNRILDAHRQIGSIMKPFVFLAALENRDTSGKPYTPLTLVDDVPFNYRFEGQSWSPKNYANEYAGEVPLFYALKNSLNAATAKVGLQIGLDKIISVARRAGYTSELLPYPSLTLGAFEIYPWEVATGLLTIARMGNRLPLTFIRYAEDLTGTVTYEPTLDIGEQVFAPQIVAILIGMMKQTLLTGTARSSQAMGFHKPAAGKTGTTSDTKDTWFAGFTPHILTVTWTGYDDNTPTGLTGASGALPLWIEFMNDFAAKYPSDDFAWPESVKKIQLSPDDLKKLVSRPKPHELLTPTELVDY